MKKAADCLGGLDKTNDLLASLPSRPYRSKLHQRLRRFRVRVRLFQQRLPDLAEKRAPLAALLFRCCHLIQRDQPTHSLLIVLFRQSLPDIRRAGKHFTAAPRRGRRWCLGWRGVRRWCLFLFRASRQQKRTRASGDKVRVELV
jgi:hypothetical protein